MNARLAAWCSGLWTGWGCAALIWVIDNGKPVWSIALFLYFVIGFGWRAFRKEQAA